MAYSQNDLNWKNTPLGFDSGDSSNPNYGTIGMYGCYVTAIANVCRWAGNDHTPAQINQLCKDNGWFVKGDLIARDDVPSLLCSNLQFNGKTTWNDVTSMNFFADASDPNVSYIICIDASKSPGIQTHFVMVWATLGASDLEIEDSWDGVRKPLSNYGNPGVIIQSATKFTKVSGPVQPTAPPYTVLETYTPPVMIRVKPGVHKWGMNFDNASAMEANPVDTAGDNVIVPMADKVHHNALNMDYYRQVGDVDGWNVADCEPYVAPAPPPTPYIPPAAPVKGTQATKYTVKTTIMYFDSAQDATFHSAAKSIIKPGDYYQFDTKDPAIQLGTDNQHPLYWINTKDNVASIPDTPVTADPAMNPGNPLDWKTTFTPFSDGKSRRYIAQRDMFLYDLAATKAGGINIKHNDQVPIYGSVQKGGLTYLVPRLLADTAEGQIAPKEHWYGIPTTSVYTGLPNMKSQQYIDALAKAESENRVYRKSVHHETTSDKVYYAEQLVARFVKDGGRFIDGIISGATIKKIKAALTGQKDTKNK